MIPQGTDAISPAPHHDIYSIEDLRQLIYALKEATDYTKPVGVKIAAVHNVAAIASGIVRAGADYHRPSTASAAAPARRRQVIRDHVGIPIELALAAVDQRLREEGIRNQVSLVAAGGIRSSRRRGQGHRPGRRRRATSARRPWSPWAATSARTATPAAAPGASPPRSPSSPGG